MGTGIVISMFFEWCFLFYFFDRFSILKSMEFGASDSVEVKQNIKSFQYAILFNTWVILKCLILFLFSWSGLHQTFGGATAGEES